jgi:RHS repeat-associated protein
LRWTYTDPETGLQYLINRYYDPTTAQFLSVDPLVNLTQSAYGYVSDNPLNGTDPNGLWNAGVCVGASNDGFVPNCGRDLAIQNGAAGQQCLQNENECPLGGSSGPIDIGACGGVSFGTGFLGAQVSFCIGDANGHIGSTVTTGFGHTSSLGAGASITGFVADAHSLNGLGKGFDEVGGTVSPVSGGYQWGADSCGRSVHVLSGGVGMGYEVHGGETYTYVQNW